MSHRNFNPSSFETSDMTKDRIEGTDEGRRRVTRSAVLIIRLTVGPLSRTCVSFITTVVTWRASSVFCQNRNTCLCDIRLSAWNVERFACQEREGGGREDERQRWVSDSARIILYSLFNVIKFMDNFEYKTTLVHAKSKVLYETFLLLSMRCYVTSCKNSNFVNKHSYWKDIYSFECRRH
jgi:hypothetical protein